MSLDAGLVRILVCPACRGGLEDAGGGEGLLCPACSLVYPVTEEIPVLLVTEAVSLAAWRKEKSASATGAQHATRC